MAIIFMYPAAAIIFSGINTMRLLTVRILYYNGINLTMKLVEKCIMKEPELEKRAFLPNITEKV